MVNITSIVRGWGEHLHLYRLKMSCSPSVMFSYYYEYGDSGMLINENSLVN